jgi:glycosyltransferase involved in cell wall biosynthesis
MVKILFALSGLHRVNRGAEIAFLAVAQELAKAGDEVTLIGSGPEVPGRPYRYIEVRAVPRERFERFPKLPALRADTGWEELTFAVGLFREFEPRDFDVTVTCAYPFTNWVLRHPTLGRRRPPHVFVTQNGDWPAYSNEAEFRFFGCEGLVCINPDYLERNRDKYRCALIPNGVDTERFRPGPRNRQAFDLESDAPIVLMVSAMIPSKNVASGIDAVSRIPDARLVVAGDGPLRDDLRAQAERLMPGRYRQIQVSPDRMPDLYRAADVFLHLSKDESFGNVYVEAMACGLPVVAYDLPRTRWIVGEAGMLSPSESPDELSRTISAALAAGPERCEQSVARASGFRWEEIARQYRRFFEEVVAKREGLPV